MVASKKPLPIFDTLSFIEQQLLEEAYTPFAQQDFEVAKGFLLSYRHNTSTFNAYRREIERLLQWSLHVRRCSILEFGRQDIEAYLQFCKDPPIEWIGTQKLPRFMTQSGRRVPNKAWRPFVATVSKADCRQGHQPNPQHYSLARKSLREVFSAIGSFYQLMVQEGKISLNPTQQIRQKNYYFESEQYNPKIRRLSDRQRDYLIKTVERMANEDNYHERTLFIVSMLYGLYLRISELTHTKRWRPSMKDFYKDNNGLWWFVTVGKGNKRREITVSDELLDALKRYRQSLGLSSLPSSQESTPLIPKRRGKGAISSTSQIRILVQACFDLTANQLRSDGFLEEAEGLLHHTVHSLRHTGISDDIVHRPREHVRDDAGHSSKIIDAYLSTTKQDRHKSGRHKRIRPTL